MGSAFDQSGVNVHQRNTTYLGLWFLSFFLFLSSTLTAGETLMLEAEVRPHVYFADGGSFLLNYVEFGIKPSTNVQLSYQQAMLVNLYNSPMSSEPAKLFDGYFRIKVNKIMVAPEYGLDLRYQGRVYMPTDSDKATRGMIATSRNYFIFTREISKNVVFAFMECPIFHAYDRDGSGTGDKASANPIFENRLIMGPGFTWGDVSLEFLMVFQSTRFRNYQPKAKNNDAWAHALWINPELIYSVNSQVKIGAAFESGTFSDAAFTTVSDADPFHAGNFQFFIRATF